MKLLLITSCIDSSMWYAEKIGQYIPFLWEEEDYYWSREDAGYKNIVKKCDAVVFEKEHNEKQI